MVVAVSATADSVEGADSPSALGGRVADAVESAAGVDAAPFSRNAPAVAPLRDSREGSPAPQLPDLLLARRRTRRFGLCRGPLPGARSHAEHGDDNVEAVPHVDPPDAGYRLCRKRATETGGKKPMARGWESKSHRGDSAAGGERRAQTREARASLRPRTGGGHSNSPTLATGRPTRARPHPGAARRPRPGRRGPG